MPSSGEGIGGPFQLKTGHRGHYSIDNSYVYSLTGTIWGINLRVTWQLENKSLGFVLLIGF